DRTDRGRSGRQGWTPAHYPERGFFGRRRLRANPRAVARSEHQIQRGVAETRSAVAGNAGGSGYRPAEQGEGSVNGGYTSLRLKGDAGLIPNRAHPSSPDCHTFSGRPK